MYYGERFNSISHVVGVALAVLGTALLVLTAARLGDPWKIVSFSIYGAMLIVLYGVSCSITACAGVPRRYCASSTTVQSTC